LHGNTYLEVCQKCKESYLRPYDCMKTQNRETRKVNIHFTGRLCEKEGCDGKLYDSIVHFGENLPLTELNNAEEQSNSGDLAIVVGTSMKVQPACLLPRSIYSKEGGKMVICNLQKTPFDEFAVLKIRGHVDDIFHLVMKELGIEVPMTTPEGYEVPIYEDKIEEKYLQKIKETKEKLELIRLDKIEEKRDVGSKIQSSNQKFRSSELITYDNEKVEFDITATKLLYFCNCKNSQITVPKKKLPCIKVIIESCNDTVIDLSSTILTNTIEIINCNGLILKLNTIALTITCDKSTGVTIQISERRFFQTLINSLCNGITISVLEDKHEVPLLSDLDQELDPQVSQIITHYVKEKITSEVILREGEGYISTKRMNEEYKEEARLNQEAYEKWVSGMITFEGKNEDEKKDDV